MDRINNYFTLLAYESTCKSTYFLNSVRFQLNALDCYLFLSRIVDIFFGMHSCRDLNRKKFNTERKKIKNVKKCNAKMVKCHNFGAKLDAFIVCYNYF